MIDIRKEHLLSMRDAAAFLPPLRKSGKPIDEESVYRWARVGLRGVILESIQVGGTKCTSQEALQRFCDEISKRPGGQGGYRRKA